MENLVMTSEKIIGIKGLFLFDLTVFYGAGSTYIDYV